ncbi:hypothetical protein [Campylobacter concisus]|jgi:hypothetical protein|uniref:hypothetical protein n=1 Tax=Campylobacter concisus TaxID=199 RepID=UPI000CD8E5AC|nr:hypothetical protein [Campylobacter concisus]
MLILTNPNQTPSKDKYNKLIKMTAGNVELTDEVLYCVGYDIFCSNIVALKDIESKQETIQELKAKVTELSDELEQKSEKLGEITTYYVTALDEIDELQKENAELKRKLSLKEQK